MEKLINIMGVRGIPPAHGGFETFAARIALFLRERGWIVNVYCQIEPDAEGNVAPNYQDTWEGINRLHIGTTLSGSVGSVIFDWKCTTDVLRRPGIDLVLGYNTAIFTALQRLRGRQVLMNMDGVEWKRAKWSAPIKAWFYLNEMIGANLCNVPIADHPEIANHLKRHGCHRAVVIPYGSDLIANAPAHPVLALGLEPNNYLISIARLEPENSILEMVRGFSAQPRAIKLVVLGFIDSAKPYHRAVQEAASADVIFPGAIYAPETVSALRFHALAYVHGHQVGGTNPSLVEALGAGNAVIAHDNRFNRWVAGSDQFYFSDEAGFQAALLRLAEDPQAVSVAQASARKRHGSTFTWDAVLRDYETLLLSRLSA